MTKIYKNLHVGNLLTAREVCDNDEWIVITVADNVEKIGHYHFPVSDPGTKETDREHFKGAVAATFQALNTGKNVLVHCKSGINRSTSVVISVIMKMLDMQYVEAYNFVETKHPGTWPYYPMALHSCSIEGKEPPSINWKLHIGKRIVSNICQKIFGRTANSNELGLYAEKIATNDISSQELEQILIQRKNTNV